MIFGGLMTNSDLVTRRDFVKTAGAAFAGASMVSLGQQLARAEGTRRRYAIVGTGDRASGMWGSELLKKYPDVLEFVGLCDSNSKRVEAFKKITGAECPTFTNY